MKATDELIVSVERLLGIAEELKDPSNPDSPNSRIARRIYTEYLYLAPAVYELVNVVIPAARGENAWESSSSQLSRSRPLS